MHAIDLINKEEILSPSQLVGVFERVNADDEFQVYRSTCYLLSSGVMAIVGPTSGRSADHVQSTCDNKEIPHVQARWDTRQPRHRYVS